MSGLRARGVTAAMILIAGVSLGMVALTGTVSASESGSGSVTPVLECVWHVNSTSWLALWGYANSSGSTQTIPIGARNAFTPGAQGQGQPTTFQAGTVDNLFTVPFVASDPPAWTLDGSTVGSSPSDKKCNSEPVPIVAGTNGWSAELPLIFVALGILAVGFGAWRFDPTMLGLRRKSPPRPEKD